MPDGRAARGASARRPSLKRQLLVMFLCVIIPVSVLLSLLLVSAADYSRSRLAHTSASGLQMFASTLERQMLSVESYLVNLSLNDETFRTLSAENSRTRCYLDICAVAQSFPALLAANDTLMGLVLVNSANGMYRGRYSAAAPSDGAALELNLALEGYVTRIDFARYLDTEGWYIDRVGGRLCLLRSVAAQKASITAAIDLQAVFEELLPGYGLEGETLVYARGADGSRRLLLGDEAALPGAVRWHPEGYGVAGHGNKARLVVRRAAQMLELYYVFPYQHRGLAFGSYEMLLILASVFVVTAIPFLLAYMRQEIFRPMGLLVRTMNRISSGELSARSDVDYRNAEFTQVNETFNHMIDQITRLKIDQYEKELEARRNEMTALKLQIRPHFILNCLKSVYGMVQTGSRQDAQTLILLLSRHLRYILSFTTNTIPLRSEVEQCCNYAELSSVGQPDPVELRCEVDRELGGIPVPQVSLLTLVENSIKHGRVIGRPLSIDIAARVLKTEEGWVANLTVSDNGAGFSPGQLARLNRGLPEEEGSSHVGLHNVVRRLQLLYGPQAAVAFANRSGGGARVEMFLPLDDGPAARDAKAANEKEDAQ